MDTGRPNPPTLGVSQGTGHGFIWWNSPKTARTVSCPFFTDYFGKVA